MMTPPTAPERKIARERAETDACQAGTPGCCIDHGPADEEGCDTW